MTDAPRSAPMHPSGIYYLHPLLAGPLAAWPAELSRIASMGFGAVAMAAPFAPGRSGRLDEIADHDRAHPMLETEAEAGGAVARIADACRAAGLTLILDLAPERVAAEGTLAAEKPEWFRGAGEGGLDPRRPPAPLGVALADLSREEPLAWWEARLRALVRAGVGGFRCTSPAGVPVEGWSRLIAAATDENPATTFLAWTPGMAWDEAAELKSAGFDLLCSSLAWWNLRDGWLAEERAALPGPLLGFPEAPFGTRLGHDMADPATRAVEARRALRLAAGLADALLVPMGFEYGARRPLDPAQDRPGDWAWIRENAPYDLSPDIAAANALVGANAPGGAWRVLTGPGAPAFALLRAEGADPRVAPAGTLLLANTALHGAVTVAPEGVLPGTGGAFGPFRGEDGVVFTPGQPLVLAPGEVRLLRAMAGVAVQRPAASRPTPEGAVEQPRIAIEAVSPLVDGGRFPIKRVVGEVVEVEADVVTDGHGRLAVALLWRAADDKGWRELRMRPLGNDRYAASFPLERLGRHQFMVEAWIDVFGAYQDELQKKHGAGLNVTLELEEGRRLVAATGAGRPPALRKRLGDLAERIGAAGEAEKLTLLLSPATATLMASADPRPHRVRQTPVAGVEAERIEARFASWYEIFPRSQSGDVNRHGTLDDVIRALPRIRDMGFDVLYFPPIHPIGKKNRKGRNNTLTPGPDDVGSPYAIGSEEGGHEALHPALGTMEDFRRLRDAAHAHGLELALDFAIQCSPDHPWLKAHPEWFDWRPDGTIKYAENPPKKYEDIVNVDFYAEGAKPSLWVALRDSVRFWVEQGVKTFRVDNPHTKPFPFWEWMIGEIRATNPEVLFLSEAFTRPKVMYRLAKIGFSQSYTYFTWRNTKAEMAAYLTELSTTAPKDFFRPHFFVNTPDINPVFLQTSGRPGHLIRAALAATLSGLWGVYNGFELCDARPVPGKEEYLDSEKYEIRAWDYDAPGNIVPEITRLNAIRRANPALQTHLGVEFLQAYNDQVLYYEKATPDRSNVVLVAVSMDPAAPQTADIELPLWKWGLPDHAGLEVEDLMRGNRFTLHGKAQQIRLDPGDQPFAIWRVRPIGT